MMRNAKELVILSRYSSEYGLHRSLSLVGVTAIVRKDPRIA